ncbi:phosphorylase, glycogen/starch/alpha-glucan family [Anaerococcus hydrogenalis DSM 7454]|uniref:Alpha-1,4 glucan phosphorylase n=1 Tax=Anaerococcus hydrogenalis DSM 7454 TaxID=561177 RepID=B6W8A8_9FIRM|nr:glycogen/starch/alpha-glucan phosphorylase [Anaerococcus hydrogenalis]EEB36507.1 phosphorylase, glycogen/starch/alpha-glucan family [Anaerococcus hydrogenalis DSM 7454]
MKKVNNFILKRIQNFLYSFYAKDVEDARINEIYDGLVKALLQDIGKNWSDSKKYYEGKELYILSFEYNPGKFLSSAIKSLNYEKEVDQCLSILGLSMDDLIAYEREASLGNSEIGFGSWYLAKELSKNKIKSISYALRYESGGMKQKIIDGSQFINSNEWLYKGNKWEHKKAFSYIIKMENKQLKSVAYDMPIFNEENDYVNTLRLWKAESINKINYLNNTSGDLKNFYNDYIDNNSLTQFLYLDNSTYEGKLFRLKQEYFYSVSSVQDILRRYFKKEDDIRKIDKKIKVIISDIHPSLAILEFIRCLNVGYGLELDECVKLSKNIFNHIGFLLTPDSREYYDIEMIKLIDESMYDEIINLDKYCKDNLDLNIIENQQLRYDRVNYCFVGKYFYLSKTFVENYKIDYKKFSYINFGIDRDMYASSNNINLKNVLNNYRIDINNDISLEKLNDLKNNSNLVDDLEEAKYKNKLSFIESFDLDKNKSLNPYSIFDMQLTMFHEAKRQLLNAINIASIYYMLKENSNIIISPTTYIFSGKANDGYYMAKEIIKFIFALKHMIDKDRLIKEKIKIIFIEDLNVEKLKLIYPACDVYSNLTLPIFDNQSFEMMHSIFNFSNVISSKGGVLSNFNKENKIYTFGKTYDELVMTQKTYNANDFYYKNDIIKITVDNLINEDYNNLPYNFKNIFDYIISYNDSFLIFKDNKDLLDIRLKLGKDYLDKRKWINNEIANILWAKEFNLGKNLEILK